MNFLQIPQMDISNKTPILLFLIICINTASGLDVPPPDDLVVHIIDGEVIVDWRDPANAPSNFTYNVEMGRLNGEWAVVESCTGITKSYCELSSFIQNYNDYYKVKVQLVAGEDKSKWISKKVRPNESELMPPSFTLLATSSSLAVHVHQKPILKKIFPFGLTYTIFLEEKGTVNKNTTAYLKDEVWEGQTTKTFSSLQWGRQYCVSMMVEGNGALSVSGVSPQQCLHLPEQGIVPKIMVHYAVFSLSTLAVLAIITISAGVLICYLKGPEKTPAALKSPASNWHPLSVGEGAIEVVTDKGWFLSSYRTEVKNCVKHPVTHHITVMEDNEDENRRTSMDSGVSMVSSSAMKSGGSSLMTRDDSGCGSLGGPESSTSSQTDYPVSEERTHTDTAQKREDSGLGLGCRLHSSSMNLDGQDNRLLKESVLGGNYRTQSPSAMQIHDCDNEETLKLIHSDTDLAEVITGYRAGPQSCICSGAGQCTWCHKQGHYGSDIKQYRTLCIENAPLSSKCDLVDSYKAGFAFSSYSKKSQMDSIMMNNFENTFTQLGESFPLLTTLVDGQHDLNMNNVSLSLCDVQLTTD
ncbi:hypothetical protein INR49_031250 [Caranx melampygus]|nr:hypothetical protein INR49_031250 [Caranx melampygus]